MGLPQLKILFSSEVLPWERKAVEGISEHLAPNCEFTIDEISPSKRGLLASATGPTWIISNRWRETLKFVGAYKTSFPVFVSIIHPTHYHPSWYQMMLNKVVDEIPRNIEFVVHSEFNLRYLNELEGIPKSKIHYLPFGQPVVEPLLKKEDPTFTVGGFASFESESNLSHQMSIAHYLKSKGSNIQFKIFGTGELYRHLKVQTWEMQLENTVSIIETNDVSLLSQVDLLLHLPIRQDHFLPVLYSACANIPVIASEGLGIGSYITDSHDGFILPVNNTRLFAEMILRLSKDAQLRTGLATQLKNSISKKFSWAEIIPSYEKVFFGIQTLQTQTRAA